MTEDQDRAGPLARVAFKCTDANKTSSDTEVCLDKEGVQKLLDTVNAIEQALDSAAKNSNSETQR